MSNIPSTPLDDMDANASSRHVTFNEDMDAVSPAGLYGRQGSACVALTWAYYGGVVNIAGTPTVIAGGTLALTDNATCYIRASTTTGAVSFVTSAPSGWPGPLTGYVALYQVTTLSGVVTASTDYRTVTPAPALTLTALDARYQALDSDLTTIAGLTATTDSFMQAKSSAWASRTVAQVTTDLQGSGLTAATVGFRNVPQNSQSAGYTTVAADSGKHLLHPSADTTPRTFTIDSNANVAYPVGTAITFVNQSGAGTLTIAITTDTLRLAGAGTTGSRTLAPDGIATALKITSTVWLISGTGLS